MNLVFFLNLVPDHRHLPIELNEERTAKKERTARLGERTAR